MKECQICDGTGRAPGSEGQQSCGYCGGTGENRDQPLPRIKGSGSWVEDFVNKTRKDRTNSGTEPG